MKKLMLPVALCAAFVSGSTAVWAQSGNSDEHNHSAPTPLNKSWSSFPLIEPVKGRFSRSEKRVRLSNFEANGLDIWASMEGKNLEKAKTTAQPQNEGNIFAVKANGFGGYRYLVAQHQTGNQVTSGATTTYFSMPSPSPKEMLSVAKSKLEVLPVILPREHGHFQENTEWAFIVRYDGVPLVDKTINFATQNGAKNQFSTDQKGQVKITFPQDFPKAETSHGNGHGRRYAQFVVSATHQDDGITYTSAFNDQYAPGPFSQKSVWAGVGFMALGMAGALPLWRRKNKKGAKS